jgi:NADPH-dependent 7-cyano-7-deazaguanine reductase QueF-like protein
MSSNMVKSITLSSYFIQSTQYKIYTNSFNENVTDTDRQTERKTDEHHLPSPQHVLGYEILKNSQY